MEERTYYDNSMKGQPMGEQTSVLAKIVVGGLTLGALAAMVLAAQQEQRSRRTFGYKAERFFKSGRDSGEQMIEDLAERLEKLRRTVEDRLSTR